MEMKTNYYEEIQKGVERLDGTKIYVRTLNEFFSKCQLYYWHYIIRKKTEETEPVLKDYYIPEEFISKKETEEDSPEKTKYDLCDKLYLEFLSEIQQKFYKGKKGFGFDKFLDRRTFEKDINDCFRTEQKKLLDNIARIKEVARKFDKQKEGFINSFYKKQDCRSIHNAMKIVREALNTEKPTVDVSVEAVISEEWLKKILDYLNEDCLPGAVFSVAPISKALGDGTYHKYIKGNNQVFFNLKSDYNLEQLKNRMKATKRLLEDYDYVMEELDGYRQQFK